MNQKKLFIAVIVLAMVTAGAVVVAYKNTTEAYGTQGARDKVVSALPQTNPLRDDTEFVNQTTTQNQDRNKNHYTNFASDIKAVSTADPAAISIQFFGDMMLDRNVAKMMGDKGLDYLFERLAGEDKGLYHHADLLIANLEGAFAPARVPTTKSIAFRFDPKLAADIKRYQFDAVSSANNHSLDMGWANVDFTKKTLRENGIGWFGTQTKESKDLTWIAEIPGKIDKVAFIGLNNTDHPLDMPKVTEAIKDAKEKARYVIAFMHWGVEYKRISRQQERDLAHLLIDKGVTAVIGAHPHVIQEMELYEGKPIFYSLGNFIFDQYFSTDTQQGLSVGMILENGAAKTVYAFPLQGEKSQVELMEPAKRDEFLDWFNTNGRLGDNKFVQGKLEL